MFMKLRKSGRKVADAQARTGAATGSSPKQARTAKGVPDIPLPLISDRVLRAALRPNLLSRNRLPWQ
jgi:hypothetical protein